jgi:Ni,Fe-hydrogenase III small subunit
MGSSALCSSHSPRVLISCGLCLIGAQVEGTTISEAVQVEGVVPEAEITAGATSEPMQIATPGVT